MSYTPSVLVSCPNLQENLDRIFTIDAASFYREPIPFTEYLMSPINRNGISAMVSTGGSKIRTATLTYQPRILPSEVQSDVTAYCSATTERGNTSEDYSIDTTKNLFLDQQFDVEKLKSSCEDNEMWFQEQIMKLVAAMDTAVNAKNATQAAALLGGWSSDVSGVPFVSVDGSDNLVVQTLQPSSAFAPFPATMQSVQSALEASNFGQAALFGGFQLDNYLKLIESGCCANYGLDIADIQARFGMASVRDRNVASALGGNEYAMAVSNGALQIIDYNRWTGLFAAQDSNQSYGTIQSPATGLRYDLVVKHDCGVIDVTLTATTKVVSLPADMYQTGDHLEGVKGLARIKVTNV